ncbi:hypothetical protein F5X99DRAFT_425153 [Biscogniauxia marginata]|nr:hypothetical protein F5X99DRAFT_425153 [Biscogniauxia marginata]
MSSRRISTSREQNPLRSPFPQEPSTPGTPPPAYTEGDERRAQRHFVPQDQRNTTSPSSPGPMTVPVIVITHATNRCETKLCKKRAIGASSYCRKHKCHVESCISHRETGEGEIYCSKHSCRWPECRSRATRPSRYCSDHKCRQVSCVAARLSSTERSFCAFHACRQQDCGRRREIWSEFCRGHICQVKDCARGITSSSALCRRHKCEIHGCQALRPAHANFCPRHQCEVGDCERGQADRSRYCGSHKCASDGCPAIRKQGLRYCTKHRDRSHERPSTPMPDIEVLDSSAHHHDAYNRRRVLRPRKNFIGEYSNHACRWGGCPDSPLSHDGYCRTHTCALGGCAEQVLEDGVLVGPYCRQHTCTAEHCAPRVSRGAYCSHHECQAQPCPNSRFWSDDRGAYREHVGCRFHTCVQRSCYDPTPRSGGLCERHGACAWGLRPCLNSRCGRSSYCEGHACRIIGCVSPRMSDGGAYCPEHACRGSMPCPRKSEVGSMYCARHRCSQADCRLERASDLPSCEKHRYSCDMSPFCPLSNHRRLVVPLR